MKVRARDTLLALKVISVADGLIENDRRVAAALIEHFNRDTGRCDPSLNRLARLLGISVRTVIRSVGRLVTAGLFRKARHGGYLNRNRYEPVWPKFADHEAAWNVKFKADARARVTEVSPGRCQPRHLPGDAGVIQTCAHNNLPKETCARSRPSKEYSGIPVHAFAHESERKRVTTSSSDAARAEAERRWSGSLLKHFGHLPTTHAEIIAAITPEIQFAATNAEMRQRGAGLAYLVRRLRLRDDPCPPGAGTEPGPMPRPLTAIAAAPDRER